jgi:D-threo-aldose 1-dehydrogenase
MVELKRTGQVRAIGLGVNESEVCIELLEHCELDCILLAGRYTLLEQPALGGLLPLCGRRGVSIICGGPFNSGVLAAGSSKAAETHYNYAPPPEHVIERVRQLEACCADFGVPLKAAALQFPLGCACIATVVAGCSSGAESREVVRMFEHPIPATFWRALRERGLVHADAALPGIGG